MTTKTMILNMLENNSDGFLSGEKISTDLKISRTAVSKAIQSLRDNGYEIESRKHYGYSLKTRREDILNKETLEIAFRNSGLAVYFLDTTASTNKDAKLLLSKGGKTPYLVTCSSQTAGRGRLGRSFSSPPGGVYFSLVLDGKDIASPDLVTVSAAVAIAETMEKLTGIGTSIKWVNDIYIRGKKAVGILTEGIFNMEEAQLDKVVIGCGINLKTLEREFPLEVREIATSFYPDGKSPLTRSDVIAATAKRIVSIQKEDFISLYRKKCFVIGKDVYVVKGGERTPAYAYSIDDSAHLLVRYPDGREEALSSGEISIRLKEGTSLQ